MPLPQLPANPSDVETVATFRAAAVYLHGEFHRAWAGLCVNLGGVFHDASQRLYRVADLIEGSSSKRGLSEHAQEFERAERALEIVLSRLNGWTALHDYISELAFRRTGVRPPTPPPAAVRRRARGEPRYLVAELLPTVAPVQFEIAVGSLKKATEIFDERENFHRTALRRVVPMILSDRRRGVLVKSVGDLSTFDLTHHGVNGVLSLQPGAKQ